MKGKSFGTSETRRKRGLMAAVWRSGNLKVLLLGIFLLPGVFSLYGKNLLRGDSSAETEVVSLTNGPYGSMIYGGGSAFAHADPSVAFEGKKSLKTKRAVTYSTLGSYPLTKGKKYTFSFYAKASENNVRGMINCPRTGLIYFPDPKGAKTITYTTNWRRFTYTFTAKHSLPHAGLYKVNIPNVNVWFDAFQLEEGEKATPYKPCKNIISGIELNEAPGSIYYMREKLDLKIHLRRFAGKESGKGKVIITNEREENVKTFSFTPKFVNGYFSCAVPFTPPRPGWYKVVTELKGEKASRQFVVTVDPGPLDNKIMPFSSFCNMFMDPEILWRLGGGWRNFCLGFDYCAATPGKINIWGVKNLQDCKKLGLKVKMMININPPPRFYTKMEIEAKKKHKLSDVRFVPWDNAIKDWTLFMEEAVKKCGPYVDIWEFGGELDARFGLNTYYKEKYSNELEGVFVTGRIAAQAAKFSRIGGQIVKKHYPKALVTAVRPCDVDSRSNYIFSTAVYKGLKGAADSFGVDSYAHPRRIGKGQALPGSVTDLIPLYKATEKVLHLADPKSKNVFISEYGYELAKDSEDILAYQKQYADCYAQSNLMARAANFVFLSYYNGLNGGGEYDQWRKNEPLPSVAAVCQISRFLRNVDKVEFSLPAHGIVAAIYGRSNGTAGGAIFTCNPEDEPEFMIPSLPLMDIYGGKITPLGKKGNMIRGKVTYSPVLFEAKNWAQAKKVLKDLKLITSNPLLAELRLRNRTTAKLYLSSRLKSESVRCLFDYKGKKYDTVVPPGGKIIVDLPITPGQKEVAFTMDYPNLEKTIAQKFSIPQVRKVPRLAKPFPIDAEKDKWKNFKSMVFTDKELIYPKDVFSWFGPDDLSCRMNLAHDGKYMYIFTAVKDDLHCNTYDEKFLARGDLLQLAWDPLTNTAGLEKDKRRPDDTNLALGLGAGKARKLFYYGPDKALFAKSKFAIVRSEKEKTTYYEIRIPLSALQIQKDHVFGFSAVAFDDDSGSRWDYYMNLFPGVTRGNDPSLYGQFILE